MKNYYLVLGVPNGATAQEIDAAFRRLARKYHPDVQPTEKDALALFKSAKEAHDVLSDAKKRREYDRALRRGQPRAASNPDRQPGQSWREFDDLSQVLAQPPWTTPHENPSTPPTALDSEAELRLVPEEAARDGPLEVRVTVSQTCLACQGRGAAAGRSCEACEGKGIVRQSQRVELWLPPGLRDGTVLHVAGRGAAAGANAPHGDLYLAVRVRPCWPPLT
jgi:DnaJ-class molecular chaperone